MAFVSSLVLGARPLALRHSSLTGASLSARTVTASSVRMEMSPAVPFLPKPPKLTPDMPGYAGFDPLGFSNIFNIKFLQEAEVKHGRVCMLATIGLLVTEFYKFPMYADSPKLAHAAHDWAVGQGAMVQLLLWIGIFEAIVGVPALFQMLSLDSPRQPGEFSFDPLGLSKSDEQFKKNSTVELINGRMAMIGIGGMIHQQFMTDMTSVQQLTSGKLFP